jgi:fumarate hydratase subunit alpha
MRTITPAKITDTIARLCLKANLELRPDMVKALSAALRRETGPRAKRCLKAVLENAVQASAAKLAICQDTGLPAVFIELGRDAHVSGDLARAVNDGVARGYAQGAFRTSIVPHPLTRGKPGFTPCVVHTEIVEGARMRIRVLPKGFGCENKSALKMFNPTASEAEVRGFVVETVRKAGPDACPPYVIGVGIGGTADYACLMAKKALLRDVNRPGVKTKDIEKRLLKEINALGIGAMGMGSRTTALAVLAETAPTHIAGLPVAVSVSCHALRSAEALI